MTTSIVLTRPLAIPSTGQTTGSPITGLSTTVINGQPMLTYNDPARANKTLSISEQNHIFSRNRLTGAEWIRVGNTSDADSGYVAEFDGTICYASGHCEDANGESKDIHVYINDVDLGDIGTLSGATNTSFTNTVLNLDYDQGDVIRLRAVDSNGSTGAIEDTIIKLTTKHRG